MLKLAQEIFVGTIGRIFLVNTIYFFRAIWAALSVFIDPVTRAKVKILGSDWISTLNENGIPCDQIPQEWGGIGAGFVNGEDNLLKNILLSPATSKQNRKPSYKPTITSSPALNLESEKQEIQFARPAKNFSAFKSKECDVLKEKQNDPAVIRKRKNTLSESPVDIKKEPVEEISELLFTNEKITEVSDGDIRHARCNTQDTSRLPEMGSTAFACIREDPDVGSPQSAL